VSDLLPNLPALLEKLAGDSPAVHDAQALTKAVADAESEEEIDAALNATISQWRLA
jgi:hypothetical protein